MAKHKVDLPHSTSVQCCEYDDEVKEMHITFASGGKHKFEEVEKSDFDALCKSESPGKHFHTHIRRNFKSSKVD